MSLGMNYNQTATQRAHVASRVRVLFYWTQDHDSGRSQKFSEDQSCILHNISNTNANKRPSTVNVIIQCNKSNTFMELISISHTKKLAKIKYAHISSVIAGQNSRNSEIFVEDVHHNHNRNHNRHSNHNGHGNRHSNRNNCLTILHNCKKNTSSIELIHLEFHSQSQRDWWLKRIHQCVLKYAYARGGYGENIVISKYATVIEYTTNADEQKFMSGDFENNVNMTVLSNKKIGKIRQFLLNGTYFKVPSADITTTFSTKIGIVNSINPFTNNLSKIAKKHGHNNNSNTNTNTNSSTLLSSSSSAHTANEEIFMILAKPNRKSHCYTHLRWDKTRKLNSDTMQFIYLGYILSVSVNSIASTQDSNERRHFLKIIWAPFVELQPLILYYHDCNYLLHFAKALIYVCESKGIQKYVFDNYLLRSASLLAKKKSNPYMSKQSNYSIFCGTYNVGAGKPNQSLQTWLQPSQQPITISTNADADSDPDIYAICFQELIDLSSANLLLSDHQMNMPWELAIGQCLGPKYQKLESVVRGGVSLSVFVKRSIFNHIIDIQSSALNVGPMGAPNKAGVAITMEINCQSLCFVGCHLHSGHDRKEARNDAFFKIYTGLVFEIHKQQFGIMDHNVIFWMGDLNYRLNFTKNNIQNVFNIIRNEDSKNLLKFDQLSISMRHDKAWHGFMEAPINFLPTYKFQPGTNNFETRKSQPTRIPSYTDRILHKCSTNSVVIRSTIYDACRDLIISDHKPVYCIFEMCIIDQQVVRAAAAAKEAKQLRRQQRQQQTPQTPGLMSRSFTMSPARQLIFDARTPRSTQTTRTTNRRSGGRGGGGGVRRPHSTKPKHRSSNNVPKSSSSSSISQMYYSTNASTNLNVVVDHRSLLQSPRSRTPNRSPSSSPNGSRSGTRTAYQNGNRSGKTQFNDSKPNNHNGYQSKSAPNSFLFNPPLTLGDNDNDASFASITAADSGDISSSATLVSTAAPSTFDILTEFELQAMSARGMHVFEEQVRRLQQFQMEYNRNLLKAMRLASANNPRHAVCVDGNDENNRTNGSKSNHSNASILAKRTESQCLNDCMQSQAHVLRTMNTLLKGIQHQFAQQRLTPVQTFINASASAEMDSARSDSETAV